jgi:hypothetical protein
MRQSLPRALLLVVLLAVVSACGAPAAVPSQATSAPQPTTAPATTEAAVATAAPAATATEAPLIPTEAPATVVPTATTAPTPTTEPSPTADAAANAPQGQGALDLLLEAAKAQLAQKAWRTTLTITEADGKETKSTIEFVKPGSLHMVTPSQEIIVVKDGTFMKRGADKWIKSPVDMSGMITDLLSQQGLESIMKDVKYEDIKLAGVDMINGKPAWIYQYKSSMDVGGTKVATDSKTWIGVLDKLPYKMEGVSDTGKGGKTTVTGVYEYPDNITIEAPNVTG